jgi:hypothetical protein
MVSKIDSLCTYLNTICACSSHGGEPQSSNFLIHNKSRLGFRLGTNVFRLCERIVLIPSYPVLICLDFVLDTNYALPIMYECREGVQDRGADMYCIRYYVMERQHGTMCKAEIPFGFYSCSSFYPESDWF